MYDNVVSRYRSVHDETIDMQAQQADEDDGKEIDEDNA